MILAAAGAGVLAAVLGASVRRHRQPPPPGDPDPIAHAAAPAAPRSPAPPPSPQEAPARVQSGAPAPRPPLDEAALMARLHDLAETNPALTLVLAREGNARFSGSPDAPERAWMLVKSLVNLERFDEARAEAREMVRKYPGTSWAQDLQRHLLSNPP
jgi:hypothetical protein